MRRAESALAFYALDLRPECAQALVDALVAFVDVVHGADRRGAFRAEAREQYRHAGSNVRAFDALPAELRGPGHDGPVGVAEDDPRAHADQIVGEEQPVLEHLLEHEDRP